MFYFVLSTFGKLTDKFSVSIRHAVTFIYLTFCHALTIENRGLSKVFRSERDSVLVIDFLCGWVVWFPIRGSW